MALNVKVVAAVDIHFVAFEPKNITLILKDTFNLYPLYDDHHSHHKIVLITMKWFTMK